MQIQGFSQTPPDTKKFSARKSAGVMTINYVGRKNGKIRKLEKEIKTVAKKLKRLISSMESKEKSGAENAKWDSLLIELYQAKLKRLDKQLRLQRQLLNTRIKAERKEDREETDILKNKKSHSKEPDTTAEKVENSDGDLYIKASSEPQTKKRKKPKQARVEDRVKREEPFIHAINVQV